MRVASIDCGTNSIRLLIADVDLSTETLTEVESDMIVVRLGQGVDRTGEFAPDALERTFAAVEDYGRRCSAAGVERMRFVATSATRDASNREVFIAGVRDRLGIDPEVITGEEEARLSFRGATGALDPAHPAPFLVVDLGGGSTEFVLGGVEPEAEYSMNIGCVRMFERHAFSDPPTEAEVASAIVDIDRALDEVAAVVPLGRTRTLVGVAGSVTTVAAHALDLPRYDRSRIHGTTLSIDDACDTALSLIALTHDQRAALPYMDPGRVDVIGAGALIWMRIIVRVRDEVGAQGGSLDEVVTSEHDILDGIAWSLAAGMA